MPRVPLPIKVFLSYLLVLAIGIGPIYFYLDRDFERGAIEADVRDLGHRTQALSSILGELPANEWVPFLQSRRAIFQDRVSLIDREGRVVFDTQPELPSTDHNDRPEVRRARGMPAPQALVVDDSKMKNAGFARRISTTAKDERLYVALAVTGTAGTDAPVIRVSRSVSELLILKSDLTGFMRNTLALAISVAILLSLLSAFVIVRPLLRVRKAAAALAAGDWTVEVEKPGGDEIGDIARSIAKLGAELRKRMAAHGSAEGLIEQLVEVTPAVAAIFSQDGAVIAVNGAGRVALHIEGPTAGRRIRQLLQDERVVGAMKAAEDEGIPQAIRVSLDDGRKVIGEVCALKRPGAPPYFAFLARIPEEKQSKLAKKPTPVEVKPRPLKDVIEFARKTAAPKFDAANMRFKISKVPDVVVADAGARLEGALEHAFSACTETLAGHAEVLRVHVSVEGTRVGVAIAASMTTEDVNEIRPLVEPLGGAIETAKNEVTLWLPRA